MAVLRLQARPSAAAIERLTRPASAVGWSVFAWGESPPISAVESLARGGNAGAHRAAAWPLPAGLAVEVASRPGRRVETWLAWPTGGPPHGESAGLATLVTATAGPQTRLSIGWLLVHSSARGRGLGRRLVATILTVAYERAIDRVWIETRSDWTAATAFWRACGFSEPI